MKINKIKINGFGKIIDKEINLSENINIIFGKNEAGKSTILKFINGMFYGTSKAKNGKDISDFDKYQPWGAEAFSGKLKYTLDNGESYEIFREFKNKTPIIYNDKLEDISNLYNIDKTKGIDFLLEQIGIDEATFINTVLTYQKGIKMSENAQNDIIQKISNLVASGDENISFKKTLEKINKMQIEQIGNYRTIGRPINVVETEIERLEREKARLENYRDLIDNEINEMSQIEENLKIEETRLELLRAEREVLEKNIIKFKEIDISHEIVDGFDKRAEELKGKVDKKSRRIIEKEKKSFLTYYIFIILLIILSIVSFVMKITKVVPLAFLVSAVLILGITIFRIKKFQKNKKQKLNEIDELEKRISQELELLNKNKEEQLEIIRDKQESLNIEMRKAKLELYEKFSKKLDSDFVSSILECEYDEIMVSISNKEKRVNILNAELYTKQKEYSSMLEKIDDLSNIQEQLELLKSEKAELTSLDKSFNIAKECMELAYKKVRDAISPTFTNELCDLICKISNGKYNNIRFSDKEGLTVELEDGRYIPAERLSIGTIDQMYLSLRLSSLNTISKENMFIILDEAFAYFDNERLKNILKFMNDNYKDKQVIIFTCSNREKEILKELQISYNLIELES